MSTPIPSSVFKAARRWVELLRVSSHETAWTLLRSESRYTDLSRTQYGAGLDLLSRCGLLSKENSLEELASLPVDQLCALLYRSVLEADPPAWLSDSDILINDPAELPNDAIDAAAALGFGGSETLASIRSVHGKVDTAARQEVGLIGEQLLVALLEREWPGSTAHVSLVDDGAGYDVAFDALDHELHLEVKTTTRRGRLVIYLSRNEHEVALRDPQWRLVLVGLAQDRSIGAVASVDYAQLAEVAPTDQSQALRWQSVRCEIGANQATPGIADLPPADGAPSASPGSPLVVGVVPGISFGWLTT